MAVKKKTAKSAAKKKTAKKTVAKRKVAKKATTRKTTVKKATAKKATRKTAAKKTAKKATRKTTAKKAPAKKAAAPTLPAVKAFKEPLKGQNLFKKIVELTDISLKDVKRVFEALEYCMACSLKKKSCAEFTLPKIAKFVIRVRPARPKGKGTNPFTGEPMIIKARPAARIVKARVLKRVKDMAEM